MSKSHARIYYNGRFQETDIPSEDDRILVVGKDGSNKITHRDLLNTIPLALKHHGIPFFFCQTDLFGGYFVRNLWVRFPNGVYVPNHLLEADKKGEQKITMGNGGMLIQGDDFCMLSKASGACDPNSPLIEKTKIASGLCDVFPIDYLGYETLDCDTIANYIPWANIFVFQKDLLREHREGLERIACAKDAEIIECAAIMEPNFLVYDMGGQRFVMTYDTPLLAKSLEAKGIDVIALSSNLGNDFGDIAGSVRCATNEIQPKVLPKLAQLIPFLYRDIQIVD